MASRVDGPRERYFEIAGSLRKSGSMDARLTTELVGIMVEEARSRLVQASGEDMLRAQGEARILERLYRELTTEAPNQEIM